MEKTWKQTINPVLARFKKETDKIFSDYNKEVKQKKLTTISDTNKLWNEKYKSKFDRIEKKHNEEYSVIWYKFHKK